MATLFIKGEKIQGAYQMLSLTMKFDKRICFLGWSTHPLTIFNRLGVGGCEVFEA